ncbi:hypothetical protein [Desulfovibrio sp. Huiquan2017]|uniref:hypothetical protein n=1 Tax=Desulfovibrio sp. Huiquan2017 TaxID=2816861 RepID=UPI001A91BE72|nr:hypothetical protein [Desulfovibrio sp. Huiquan2017]
MRVLASVLLSLLALCCLAACGGNDAPDDPKLSDEGKEIVRAMGGPFTEAEFNKFLADLPEIPGLAAQSMPMADDASDASQAIKNAIGSHGWDEDRFLYIYSHAMTMMNYDQMQHMAGQMRERFQGMPEDQRKAMEQTMAQQIGGQMEALRAEVDKQIPTSEQDIVRKHMTALTKLMGMR